MGVINRSFLSRKAIYTPPAGRLRGRGEHTSCRFRASFSRDLNIAVAPNQNSFEHAVQLGDFFQINPGSTVGPYGTLWCPDAYRALYGWGAFTLTGMKMEIYVQTRMFGSNTVNMAGLPGYQPWSIEYQHESVVKPTQGGTGTLASYAGVALETLTAQYPNLRVERFDPGVRNTALGGTYRFMKRYVKLPHMITNPNEGANSVVWPASAGGGYNLPPVIQFNQNSHVIHYAAPLVGGTPATLLLQPYIRVKATVYGRCYQRLRTPLTQFWAWEYPGIPLGAIQTVQDPTPGQNPACECFVPPP